MGGEGPRQISREKQRKSGGRAEGLGKGKNQIGRGLAPSKPGRPGRAERAQRTPVVQPSTYRAQSKVAYFLVEV